MSVGKKISIVISCLAIVLAGVLLYMYYPAILGTINGSKYYSAIDVQNSYNKGYDDGNIAGNEISEKLTYYSTLIGEYEEDIRFLNTEITNLNEMNKTNEVKVAELTALKNANLETISNLHTTIDENEATINDLNNEIRGLNTEIDNLNTTITNHQLTIERKNSEIDSLNAEIDDLNNQIAELTASGEDKDDEIANLQSQIEVLEGTIVTKNAEIESLNTEILELESTNEGLNAEIVELNNTISNLTGENNEHLTTIGSLKEQIGALNNRINTLTIELTSAQNEIQELNNRIVGLQQTIEDYEEYIATLEASANLVVAIFEFDNKVYSIESVGDNHLVHVDNPVSTDNVIFNYWMVNGERVDLAVYEVMTTTKFIANVTYKYNITFEVDGEVYATQLIEENTCVQSIQEPVKEKYTFNGWSIDGYNVVDVFNLPITTNITFKAIFTSTYGLFNTDTGENIYTWDELIDYEYLALNGTTLSAGENVLRVSGDLYIDNDVVNIADKTFANCSGLAKVIIPEGVKTIGVSAFNSAKSLSSVTLPKSLVSVGENAFYTMTLLGAVSPLTKVNYNGTIEDWCKIDFGKDYGSNPAYYTKGLYINNEKVDGTITIPSTITEIKTATFAGFTNEFVILGNIESIGDYAFYESTLSFMVVPNSLKSIGTKAFSQCVNLATFNSSTGLQSVKNYAFENCGKLTSFDFSYVQELGKYSFKQTGLTSVRLTSNVLTLQDGAFDTCSSLTEIYYDIIDDTSFTRTYGAFRYIREDTDDCSFEFGSNVRVVGNDLLEHCGFSTFTLHPNMEKITEDCIYWVVTAKKVIYNTNNCNYFKTSSTYTLFNSMGIEELVIKANVTSLPEQLFIRVGAKNVVFEDNGLITSLPNKLFYNSTALESIYLPNTLQTLGSQVFYGCNKLVNVVMQEGVTSVGSSLFYDCYSLTSIDFLPKSLTTYSSYMFYRCSGLISLDLSNVQTIQDRVFYECKGLKSVYVCSNVQSIGTYAFYGCTNLTLLEIDSNFSGAYQKPFDTIGNETNKVDIIVKEGVTSIGNIVYSKNIGDIVLPTTLTSFSSGGISGIAENMYFNCISLQDANIAWEGRFEGLNDDDEPYTLHIGSDVEEINYYIFANSGVGEVIFAEDSKVTKIDIGAFNDTKITSIVIPESVVNIGYVAFSYCENLTSIYISATSAEIATYTSINFSSDRYLAYKSNANLTIYLAGAEEDYTFGKYWKCRESSTDYYSVVFDCSYDDYLNAITSTEV